MFWRILPVPFRSRTKHDRDVLLRHLKEEVQDLRAENMKKYWKLEEVDRIAV